LTGTSNRTPGSRCVYTNTRERNTCVALCGPSAPTTPLIQGGLVRTVRCHVSKGQDALCSTTQDVEPLRLYYAGHQDIQQWELEQAAKQYGMDRHGETKSVERDYGPFPGRLTLLGRPVPSWLLFVVATGCSYIQCVMNYLSPPSSLSLFCPPGPLLHSCFLAHCFAL
jgi:hypothetical protein